jgi:hypothetical protein
LFVTAQVVFSILFFLTTQFEITPGVGLLTENRLV